MPFRMFFLNCQNYWDLYQEYSQLSKDMAHIGKTSQKQMCFEIVEQGKDNQCTFQKVRTNVSTLAEW